MYYVCNAKRPDEVRDSIKEQLVKNLSLGHKIWGIILKFLFTMHIRLKKYNCYVQVCE